MKNKIKLFSNAFVGMLGEFVKRQKKAGKNLKLTGDEINAVITEAFYLLGRGHNEFKKRAKIK